MLHQPVDADYAIAREHVVDLRLVQLLHYLVSVSRAYGVNEH
jgi:hypothetical protein